jgi:hypothetical protein
VKDEREVEEEKSSRELGGGDPAPEGMKGSLLFIHEGRKGFFQCHWFI